MDRNRQINKEETQKSTPNPVLKLNCNNRHWCL